MVSISGKVRENLEKSGNLILPWKSQGKSGSFILGQGILALSVFIRKLYSMKFLIYLDDVYQTTTIDFITLIYYVCV